MLLVMPVLAIDCGNVERPFEETATATALDREVAAAPPAPPPTRMRAEPKRGREGSGGSFLGGLDAPSSAVADPSDGARPGPAPKPKRMVHYNGFLRLKVTNVTETLQHASEIADAVGGYVENLTATSVTLRVPVAHFRETFKKIAKIGDVMSRSMTAQDVTDAFVATELRIKTLHASRDRLIALLGKARKAREKLRLLREIKRLTEELDQLEMQLTTIAALASFSRLSVEAVPHQVHVGDAADEPIASFRWIHRLSPFSRDVAYYEGERLELAVPKGLVELTDTDHWIAESADGVVIWSHVRENIPVGTSAFWLAAIKARLGPSYAKAEVKQLGRFHVLKLIDQSEAAYRYLIGVHVDGDDLEVVEVYYPGAEQEKRHDAAVRAAIEGGAV